MFTSIVKKIVMALSGICLSLFIVIHAIGNSSAFWGRAAFLSYADHLHSLGGLIAVFEISLLLVFVVHILLALQTYIDNLRARPKRYQVNSASGGRTLGSRSMPYTGLIILIFLIVHLNGFHFTDKSRDISEIVHYTFKSPLLVTFYIIALIALTLHVSHGFWSIFQTLGINHRRYNNLIRRSTLLMSLIVGAIFILIPLAVTFCEQFLL